MANYFSTLSNEALKNEIEITKKRVAQTRSQQEKVMLFALEAELDRRNQVLSSSENEKFKKFYEKLEALKDELLEFEIDKISGQTMLTVGVLSNDLLMQMANVINEAVSNARKTD